MTRAAGRAALLVALAAVLAAPRAAAVDQEFFGTSKENSWAYQVFDLFAEPKFLSRKSYALVIGLSKYDHLPWLPTADDAIRIKDFLLNEAGFDYVRLLTEQDVTAERVQELMLEDFPTRVHQNDRFVFYWSGHGHSVKNRMGQYTGYLPVASSTLEQLSRMISMDRLSEWDDYIPAKQVLYILDSCFSGFAGARPKSTRQDVTLAQMDRPSRHIFTAGTHDQETIATASLQGSVFTHAVLEGLRGAADSTSTFARDGLVTINELEDYVKKRVEILTREARWNKPITPQVWDLGLNEGEFFFVATNEQPVDPRTATGAVDSDVGTAKSAEAASALDEQALFTYAVVSANPRGFDLYLVKFPDGVHRELARSFLDDLNAGSPHPESDTDRLFWLSIRDSVLQAEFSLYLQLFPSGRYRDLATARLEALQHAEETTGFLLNGQSFAAHARLRHEALDKAETLPLKFVQYGLIALGFPIADPAGVLDGDTRRAMRSYQASVGAEQTGRLTPWQTVDVVLKAAQIGDEHAETAAGIMTAQGIGLQKNEGVARDWLERAVEKGNGYAEANLAILYRDGRGGDRDLARARTLLLQAREKQVPGVDELLATMKG